MLSFVRAAFVQRARRDRPLELAWPFVSPLWSPFACMRFVPSGSALGHPGLRGALGGRGASCGDVHALLGAHEEIAREDLRPQPDQARVDRVHYARDAARVEPPGVEGVTPEPRMPEQLLHLEPVC